MANETYKNNIADDVNLPLSLLKDHMVCIENGDVGSCAIIGELLVNNAIKNLQEITDALEAKFGKIEIEHERIDRDQIYHWGKVIGVSSEK